MNERLITHFENNEANRSQAVLLELMTLLGKYRNDLYLVGGWTPFYLLKLFQRPENQFQHVGSIDIDLAIDFENITIKYETIVELLLGKGYQQRKNRLSQIIPFAFEKEYQGLTIHVDFLAGEYGGTSKKHRHQKIQEDLLARKARGIDLLPKHFIEFVLEGSMPDGSDNRCPIRLANLVAILAMKGISISERYKEKDAYDIYSLIAHYKDGAQSCSEEVKPFLSNKLVKEGAQSIIEKFKSESSVGPVWAAKFMEPDNPDAVRLKQIEVYQKVKSFIDALS